MLQNEGRTTLHPLLAPAEFMADLRWLALGIGTECPDEGGEVRFHEMVLDLPGRADLLRRRDNLLLLRLLEVLGDDLAGEKRLFVFGGESDCLKDFVDRGYGDVVLGRGVLQASGCQSEDENNGADETPSIPPPCCWAIRTQ